MRSIKWKWPLRLVLVIIVAIDAWLVILAIAGVPISISFGSGPGWGPTPTAAPPPANGELSQLSQARFIHIENDWDGLSLTGPEKAYYDLNRQDGAFAGKATFSVGADTYERRAVEDVSIPLTVAQDFLALLAQSPGVSGRYQPRIEWSDDYPSVVIKVQSDYGTVRFYSESQGEDRIPWGLDQLGSSYAINSNQPAKALALLKPYLKEDVIDRLKYQPAGTP